MGKRYIDTKYQDAGKEVRPCPHFGGLQKSGKLFYTDCKRAPAKYLTYENKQTAINCSKTCRGEEDFNVCRFYDETRCFSTICPFHDCLGDECRLDETADSAPHTIKEYGATVLEYCPMPEKLKALVDNDTFLPENVQKTDDFVIFDYSSVDSEMASFLQDKAIKIVSIRTKAMLEMAVELDVTFAKFAKLPYGNRTELFNQWVESIGISPRTARNYIDGLEWVRSNFPSIEDAKDIQPSLLFAASKPSAPAELQQAVISGDITTHKQYKELETRLKATEIELEDEVSLRMKAESIVKSKITEIQQLSQQIKDKPLEAAATDVKVPEEIPEEILEELSRLKNEVAAAKNEAKAYKEYIETYKGGTKSFEAASIVDFKYAVRTFLREVTPYIYLGEQFGYMKDSEKEKYLEEIETIERWALDIKQAVVGNLGGANLIILEGGK